MSWTGFPVQPGDVLNEIDGPRAQLLEAFDERDAAIYRPINSLSNGNVPAYPDPLRVPAEATTCNKISAQSGIGGDWADLYFDNNFSALYRQYVNHVDYPSLFDGSVVSPSNVSNPSPPPTFKSNIDFFRIRAMNWPSTDVELGTGPPAIYDVSGVANPDNVRVFRQVICIATTTAYDLDASKIPANTVGERVAGERSYRKWSGSAWVTDLAATKPTVIEYDPDFTIDNGGGYGGFTGQSQSDAEGLTMRTVVTSDSLNRAKALLDVCRYAWQLVDITLTDPDVWDAGSYASNPTSGWGTSGETPVSTYAGAVSDAETDLQSSLPDFNVNLNYPRVTWGKAANVSMQESDADPGSYDEWIVWLRVVDREVNTRSAFTGSADVTFYGASVRPTVIGNYGEVKSDGNPHSSSDDEWDYFRMGSTQTKSDASDWVAAPTLGSDEWSPDAGDLPAYNASSGYVIAWGFDIDEVFAVYRGDVVGGFAYVD